MQDELLFMICIFLLFYHSKYCIYCQKHWTHGISYKNFPLSLSSSSFLFFFSPLFDLSNNRFSSIELTMFKRSVFITYCMPTMEGNWFNCSQITFYSESFQGIWYTSFWQSWSYSDYLNPHWKKLHLLEQSHVERSLNEE